MLWDINTGKLKATLIGHDKHLDVVAFSPDGKTLASVEALYDRVVVLWDINTQTRKATLQHTPIDEVVFSPDGKILASTYWRDSANVQLWDVNTATKITTLVHNASVTGIVFKPDGKTIATASLDGTVLLWAVTGTPAVPMGEAPRTAAALTPQETVLLHNYPNPFNPETWIPYQLSKPADVTLTIYDIQGRVVRNLDLGYQRAGMYHGRSRAAHWDGRNAQGEPVASGVYFYTLKAGDFAATRKMLIRK